MIRPLLLAVLLLLPAAVQATPKIQMVPLKNGPTAWLVEDRSAPVVTIQFAWQWAGSLSEPKDKSGLARFTMGMLDEGAGDLDSGAFQGKLDDLNASMDFGAGSEILSLTVRSLSANLPQTMALVGDALAKPRFDPPAIERVRGQLRQSFAQSLENGNALAGEVLYAALYPDHPLGRGTRNSFAALDSIKREDLVDFAQDRLTRSGLIIAVAGAIDAETLRVTLDVVLEKLPQGKPYPKPAPAAMKSGGQTLVMERALPQSAIIWAMPGVRRLDPDYLPAALLAHTLGGGTFTSRLKDAVREQKGLAYSVSAGIAASEVSPTLSGGASTSNANAAAAVATTREVLEELRQKGVTAEELNEAKDYTVGAMPLRLDSTRAIAGTLLGLQLDGLPPSYLDTRTADIRAVTLEQVNSLARRLLDPAKLTFVVVGQPAGLTPTTRLPEGF
ncbi:M16 family metallopeptidase [Lacibacterium aquatile]|uniref:M16 family metallopeptidase n=1 Tax=Lacibacterium aquatile TaxID=1168082 RepID=A0ABW5DKK9_9PROT